MKLHIVCKSAIFFIILMLQFSCSDKKSQESTSLRTVRIVQPERIAKTETKNYSGVIEEGKNVNASFMADGKIHSILVKEGDRIKKGQLLATLDDKDYQIGVNQLRTQLNQMTEEKKRMDEMFARHNIAPNDYEKFSAGYEQLQLQMQMAENKLGYTKLYASSDGYVSEKFMEPGELVGAGTPVFKITDDTQYYASVDMPLNVYLNKDKIISAEGISPVFTGMTIPLTIDSFTPDPSDNMLYRMKLIVPSKFAKELVSGMNISIEIITEYADAEGMKVPTRSVFEDNGKRYVWIYNPADSSINKKEITVIGPPLDNKINIAGLTGSEQIVETGVKQLYDGEKVSISNNSDYGL